MTMSSTVLASAAAAARIALAEAAVLKVGQVLQAIVAATDGRGVTTLKLGDQTVEAQLPQPLPAGTTLQLEVKTAGPTPQLVMVGQSQPAAETATAAPIPHAPSPAPPLPQPVLLLGELQAVSISVPASRAPVEDLPLAARGAVDGADPAVAPEPITEVAQILAQRSSENESAGGPTNMARVVVPTKPEPAPRADPVPAEILAPLLEGRPPTPDDPPTTARMLADSAAGPALATMPVQDTKVAAVAARLPSPSPMPAQAGSPPPAEAPSGAVRSASGTSAPAPQPQDTPLPAPTIVAPPPAAASLPGATSSTLEPETSHPLLFAQSATRPLAAAQVPQAFPVSGAAPALARTAAPGSPPQTPEAALTQMVPEAIARQASAAPLLETLAAAVQSPAALPEPVLRAAIAVLAQRIAAPDGRVTADAIRTAVAQSGIGLEASLARGTPQPMDAKAGLLALRDALAKWLGDAPSSPPSQLRPQADVPPLKGLPLRAFPADAPALPEAPRDAARLLHQEADSAISRLKLMQLASLPDSPGTAGRSTPSLRMELPFLIGHELVMAQMQIGRDAKGRRDAAGRRGWLMRFALNFSATGEVGAEVGLLGKAVNVSLWAAEPETAAAMRETLPELAGALEVVGLAPQSLRIRSGPPEPERPTSGQVLDSVS